MANLERAIAWLVYSSAGLGVVFLYVLYGTPGTPGFLFPSILAGEVIWLACAAAMSKRLKWAPYLAVVLAVITLTVSLPQPTHYTFADSGQIMAFLIFSIGSALQFVLITAVALFAYRTSRS